MARRYVATCEGKVWYGDNREDIHAKGYDIFPILDERRLQDEDKEAEETGDWKSEWELVEMGILDEPITLFRDGWGGDFYEITDAWDWDEHGMTLEFSNGTSSDEFETLPNFKVVTLDEYDKLSRDITPVFW